MKWLVVMLLLTSRFALAEPTLDEEIARAAQANKPLIVELYAEWCGPCHVFEENVLTRQDVKRALATVEFVRYDIDRPIGGEIADKFNTTGVPTFIVLDSAGKELMRQAGLPGSKTAEKWFLELIASARDGRNMAGTLEGLVRIHPDDAAARMMLAGYYLSHDRSEEAREQFAILADGADRPIAAAAFAALSRIDVAKARVTSALDAALELATKFPDTPQASRPLVLLAISKHVDRSRVHFLVEKHLQTVPDDALASAVRVALLTGHVPLARAELSKRKGRPVAAIVEAELSLYSEPTQAPSRVATACAKPGFDFDCFLLEEAVTSHWQVTGATKHMARQAKRSLELLELLDAKTIDYPDIGQLVEQPLTFRNTVAATLRSARTHCTAAAEYSTGVEIRLSFAGGRTNVAVQGSDSLATCVRGELERAPTATPPLDLDAEINVRLYFDPKPSLRGSSPIGERGAFAGFAMDPDLEVYTLLAHGQIAFGGFHRMRQIVAGDFEIGANKDGSVYAARAYYGYAYALKPWLSFSLVAGLGISDAGDDLLPRAVVLPLEARARLASAAQQFHMWFRESYVLGDSPRQRSGQMWETGDEWAFGVGTSLATKQRQPLYVQFSVENRVTSVAKVISFGGAFGSF